MLRKLSILFFRSQNIVYNEPNRKDCYAQISKQCRTAVEDHHILDWDVDVDQRLGPTMGNHSIHHELLIAEQATVGRENIKET